MPTLDLDRYRWPEDFRAPPLPSFIARDARWESQLSIAKDIVRAFDEYDMVLLEAPTGAGKSLIGELVKRLMGVSSTYTCSDKALQDQYVESFTYAKALKGRSNYLTSYGPANIHGMPLPPAQAHKNEITCADCTWTLDDGCMWCDLYNHCPYNVAKEKAIGAGVAVLNTSYLIADFRSNRAFARPLIIIDEASKLEDVILGNVEVKITERTMKKYGLTPPRVKTANAKSQDWPQWIRDTIDKLGEYEEASRPHPQSDVREIRQYERLTRLIERLAYIAAGNDVEKGWVYDGYDTGNVIFRPVHVGKYGHDLLWRHGEKFLLMDATILSADLMVDHVGFNYSINRPYTSISLPSTFPKENRPVHAIPFADMTFAKKDTAWPQMATAVVGAVNLHPDERVLIHCVSYELAKYLVSQLRSRTSRPVFTYVSSDGKARALNDYKSRRKGVLVAPSMDRGVDLPDDMCRVQVIAKVPWPNLADKRINARMYSYGGSAWYQMQTVRTIVQMTGRAVRNPTDHAVTYIFDHQFSDNLWSKAEYLFPTWWKESIVRKNAGKMRKTILEAGMRDNE